MVKIIKTSTTMTRNQISKKQQYIDIHRPGHTQKNPINLLEKNILGELGAQLRTAGSMVPQLLDVAGFLLVGG